MNSEARRYALLAGVLLLLWGSLLGALIAVGGVVARSSAIAAFDRTLTSTVVEHRTPTLNAVMETVTWLGSWAAIAAGGTFLVILAIRRRVPLLGVLYAVVAWSGASLGVSLAKQVVQRQRPPKDIWLITAHGWSWPSGHTGTATVLFPILAMTVSSLTANGLARAAAWAVAAAVVGVVGFSRIELGVHWTTDVVASMVFVSLWLSVIVTVSATVVPTHQSVSKASAGLYGPTGGTVDST